MTENKEPKVSGLLLAAGGSSRLGRPKQLVEFHGKTLIRRAAEALIYAGCSPVVVVLGAELKRSTLELEGTGAEIVINEDWKSGMGSSIGFGVRSLRMIEPQADAILISLCDQPFVTAEKLRPFIEAFRESRPDVIAAHYNNVAGVPALFSERKFSALAALQGEKGAREIIRNSPDAITMPLPDAAIDVDTQSDMGRFK